MPYTDYRENIFPSLRPHQKVLLVPGTFGCHDLGLARSDDVVSEKLELYLQWAESDERIGAYHFNCTLQIYRILLCADHTVYMFVNACGATSWI